MRPIIFFDIESTGTDVCSDRIIQLAALKIFHSFKDTGEEKNILIYPGMEIPKEATEIHGITTDMVRDKPLFSHYAKSMFEYFEGCDYAGFNIINFDVPMLSEEFARCGITWPCKDAVFYDAMKVFFEKEKRDLESALKFYCNETHDSAHDALNDVLATRKVMLAQMNRYEDLQTIEEYGTFCKNPNALDLAGKIVLNDNGYAVYNFGKDKGKVVKHNPGFGEWMLKNSFPTNTKNVVRSLINS